MGRVLLLSLNRCTDPDPVFPLGLAYLSAALRRAGHEVAWLDALAGLESLPALLDQWRPTLVGLSLRNIDDVLIRKRETFHGSLASVTETIRRHRDCPVVVGGSGFSIFPREILELSGADYGIRGAGERGIVALLAALENSGSLESVPGLVFREGTVVRFAPGAADEFQVEAEEADRPAGLLGHYLGASGMLNVQTQRGCSFRCAYCTYPVIEGRGYRRRDPESVAEEMAQLQRRGARYVFVVDSVFNSSAAHVTGVCEAILRRNLKLAWGCFLRPQGLTADLVGLMARAGLSHIEFGSDSFCDETLAAYRKDFGFEDILQASEAARQARVEFCHFLICGGPGETPESLRIGFRNSLGLEAGAILALVGMRIYPGTALHDMAVKEGQLGEDEDLLTPRYYLAPGLTADEIFAQIQEFSRKSPHWIAGDASPAYHNLVSRLRQRGVIGPLWSYFAMLQRWRPGPPAAN